MKKKRVQTPNSGVSEHTKKILEQNEGAIKKLCELQRNLK